MMTVQGVPLFFPFKKNPCVIPANPELRIRTNSLRQETLVLCVFVVSSIFLKPLFANGFWTSYNRIFGSLKHIESEYHKSNDLMLVDFTIQHGSVRTQEQGLCIAVDRESITVLTKDKEFITYPQSGQSISNIYPYHTGKSLEFINRQYFNLSLDSLMLVFSDLKLSAVQINANKSFSYSEHGSVQSKKSISLTYPEHLNLTEVINSKPTITFQTNPSIKTKYSEIAQLEKQYQVDYDKYQASLQEYNSYKALMESEVDEIKKELLMIGFNTMKPPTAPNDIDQKIFRLQAAIQELQKQDQIKFSKEQSNQVSEPLRFSASLQLILIDGHPIDSDFDVREIFDFVKIVTDE